MTQFVAEFFELTSDELLAFALVSCVVNYFLLRNKSHDVLSPLASISGVLAVIFYRAGIASGDVIYTNSFDAILTIILYWSILLSILGVMIAVIWDKLVDLFRNVNGENNHDE